MNDRFKFRVWDKENEIWLENGDCSLSMDGELTVLGMDAYGETMFCDSKNYLIEQCTGLKDKNGKLIYEGDILDNISIDEQYEVRWDEDTARFCCITDNEIYDFDNFDVTAFEVIGNIHENTDLLEVEND